MQSNIAKTPNTIAIMNRLRLAQLGIACDALSEAIDVFIQLYFEVHMVKQTIIRILCVLLLWALHSTAMAKEIVLQHNGLRLNAVLDMAAGRQLSDGVIVITHGSLAHRDMEMLRYLRKLLNDAGQSTLAINLSLAIDNRHGMYDCKIVHRHHNEDAVSEINTWVKWLARQGVKHITLLGHSRGGAQTALYAATYDNKLIKSVILMAPATVENTSAAAYESRYKKPFAPVLNKAMSLVKANNGDVVLDAINLMTCRDTPVTASTFLSYYGPNAQVDTPSLLRKIKKPVLVIVGGRDKVVVDLDKKITSLVDGKHIRMRVIQEADHMFRDLNTDDAVDTIVTFLASIQ